MAIDFCLAYLGASTVTSRIDCGAFCDAMTDTLQELMEAEFCLEWGEAGSQTGYDDRVEDTELEWRRG